MSAHAKAPTHINMFMAKAKKTLDFTFDSINILRVASANHLTSHKPEVLESWYEICMGSPTKNLEHEFFITVPKTEQ